jgi:periplasmic protein TonB
MSFARPQAFANIHPDATRIVAISAAVALNAAVLIAVMRPVVATYIKPPAADTTIRLIDHPVPPKPVDVPEMVLPAPPKHQATPMTPPTHTVVQQQPPTTTALPTDEGSAPPQPMVQAPPTAAPPTADAAPVETTLAYVAAPAPKYPTVAIRGHMAGTVTLRVLVDETGKPLDVIVENSSGHAVLDDAAKKQVLASWRFQPAVQNGQHVKAWARIPVTFNLQSQ